MAPDPRTAVILVAAGAGRRFGAPKAGVLLRGRPLVEWSAALFERFPHRVVVLRPEDRERFELPGWTRVPGGARRRDSVAAGLAALPSEVRTVLVHDAARPLAGPELVARVLEATRTAEAVVPVLPVPDTVKRVREGRVMETLDRSELVLVQTPQAFSAELLRRAFRASDLDATDEATLVEALGAVVRTVPGEPHNLKLTRPPDLALAEALLGA